MGRTLRRHAPGQLRQRNHPNAGLQRVRCLRRQGMLRRVQGGKTVHRIHRQALRRSPDDERRRLRLDAGRPGQHQAGIARRADVQLTVPDDRGFQRVAGDHVRVQLMLRQRPQGLLEQHGCPAAPFRLRVVQNRRVRHGRAVPQQVRTPLHEPHQLPEGVKLRVVAPGVEVGRAVPVGIGHGEGVGREHIDPPHQHVAGQPPHQGHALGPAVVAENLAQGAALLFRVDVRGGAGQLRQAEVEEFPVRVPGDPLVNPPREPRYNLVMHHVHTGHVLAPHLPEVVAHAAAHAGVGVVVLNDVADVLHAVRFAPLPHLPGEALVHQLGHAVHVAGAGAGGLVPRLVPQPRQAQQELRPPGFPQLFFQLTAPGQAHVPLAQGLVEGIALHVAQLRLVGEEPRDHPAEIRRVALIVLLVHLVQQHPHGVRVDQVHVVLPPAEVPGGEQHKQPVRALRQVEVHKAVLHLIRQVDHALAADRQGFRVRLGDGQDAQQRSVPDKILHQHRAIPAGAQDVHVPLRQVDLRLLRLPLKAPVGVARGELAVVQDPHAHAALFHLRHQEVQRLPPLRAAEVRVGPALQADLLHPATLDGVQLLPDGGFVLALHPQEGQYARGHAALAQGIVLLHALCPSNGLLVATQMVRSSAQGSSNTFVGSPGCQGRVPQ